MNGDLSIDALLSRIETLVGVKAQQHFSGAELLGMRKPCVYVWVRDGGEILYVGKGSAGLVRPLSAQHHRLRNDAIKDSDSLLVFQCEAGKEELIEQFLISELKPTMNGTAAVPVTADIVRSETIAIGPLVANIERMKKKLAESQQRNKQISRERLSLQRRLEEIEPDDKPGPRYWPKIDAGEYGPVQVVDEDSIHDGEVGWYDDDELMEYFEDYRNDHVKECKVCGEDDLAECDALRELADACMGAVVHLPGGAYFIEPVESLRRLPEFAWPDWIQTDSAIVFLGVLFGFVPHCTEEHAAEVLRKLDIDHKSVDKWL